VPPSLVEEISLVVPLVAELTGLPSNWNGTVTLVDGAPFRGQKRFDCGILLDSRLAGEPVRWRTLIHESLHAVSAGYNRADYNRLNGWEEGVVEKMQRLLRPQVLERLAVAAAPESVFARAEQEHLYNRYITALETLREELALTEPVFYRNLLATPLAARPGYVYGLGSQFAPQGRRAFLEACSKANAVLREERQWTLQSNRTSTESG